MVRQAHHPEQSRGMKRFCHLLVAFAVLGSWLLTSAQAAEERVRISLLMHAFRCVDESDWDRATDSDEPYLMVVGFKHPEAQSWRMAAHVFSDVDRGEWRDIPRNVGAVIPIPGPPTPTIISGEGVATPAPIPNNYIELRPGESVGFQVRMMEQDGGVLSDIDRALDQATTGVAENLSSVPVVGDIAAGLAAIADFLTDIIMAPINFLLGSADDFIGSHTVIFYLPAPGQTDPPGVSGRGVTYINAATLAPGRYGIPAINPFRIDGGSEGVYDIYTNSEISRVTVPDLLPAIKIHPTAELQTLPRLRAITGVSLTPLIRPGLIAALPTATIMARPITQADFVGDYRLFLDGAENRLSLSEEKITRPGPLGGKPVTKMVGYLIDPAGKRHEVTNFVSKAHNFSLKIQGFAADPEAVLLCKGYLLTQTRNAITGSTTHKGITYGFYGVKSKFEEEPAEASPLISAPPKVKPLKPLR
jgi:hypothetical protein